MIIMNYTVSSKLYSIRCSGLSLSLSLSLSLVLREKTMVSKYEKHDRESQFLPRQSIVAIMSLKVTENDGNEIYV